MDPKDFKPGTYKHFKGGVYTALGLVTHHHNRRPMVKYLDKDGTENVRPLEAWPEDPSGWTDIVETVDGHVQRFELVEARAGLIGPVWQIAHARTVAEDVRNGARDASATVVTADDVREAVKAGYSKEQVWRDVLRWVACVAGDNTKAVAVAALDAAYSEETL
jgi:hypothetical protein